MNHIKDVHQLPSHRNQANEQLKFIPTTQNATANGDVPHFPVTEAFNKFPLES